MIMDETALIKAIISIQDKIDSEEVTKNERLFLLSVGFVMHDLAYANKVIFSLSYSARKDSNVSSYIKTNVQNLIEIYNILGDKIAFGKVLNDIVSEKLDVFNLVKDPLRIFYTEYLTENEKMHAVSLLNELPKNFLRRSNFIFDIRNNINDLLRFFQEMYYITDKEFKYNEKVASDLLNTNNYIIRKDFFNSLRNVLIDIRKGKGDEAEIAFFENITDLLTKESEDFSASMAKILLKEAKN